MRSRKIMKRYLIPLFAAMMGCAVNNDEPIAVRRTRDWK